MRIYMDVCCLNRPFDDQSQERIKLESEAVLMILHRCEICEWVLVGSEVIELEISRIADPSRRTKVEMVYSIAKVRVRIDDDIRNRALEIKNMGFRSFDALHIACAEKAADVMLTTDDKLLKKAIKNRDMLRVRVDNPVRWLMEVFGWMSER